MYCAFLYELIDWRPRAADKQQPFSGKFLLSPLTTSTTQTDVGQSGPYSGQILQFFRDVDASVRTFAIVSIECNGLPDEAQARRFLATHVEKFPPDPCSRVLWTNGEFNPQLVELASGFLRQSRSLVPAEFGEIGKLRVVADAKGLAVIDTTPGLLPTPDRFARTCQAIALGCAYASVLDNLVNSLAAAGLKMGKAAETALKDWSRFMSAYYFSEPVRQDTIELCKLYNAARDRQKLSALAQEATEQLRLLAELVRLDRNEAQENRERKTQLRLTVFGLLLTGLGLVQAVQVTPRVITDFRDTWSTCTKELGWQHCLLGSRPEPSKSQTSTSGPSRRASTGRTVNTRPD